MAAVNMNRAQFEAAAAGSKPVLVDFWAPWCVYCRRLAPAFESIAQQYDGRLIAGKMNIDEEPAVAAGLQIEVIPTLMLLKDGEVLGRVVAPESGAAIAQFIENTLGGV